MRIELPQEGAPTQGAVDATVEKLLLQAFVQPSAEKLLPKKWIVGSGRSRIAVTRPRSLSHWAVVENEGLYFKHPKFPLYTVYPGAIEVSETAASKALEVRQSTAATRDIEVRKLQEKVKFLEMQLESDAPHLQLYRLGAGFVLMSVVSVVAWLLTGVGIPFHPLFAAIVTPAAAGVIAMAFLVRRSIKQPSTK
jgi:hypothetical protein